MFPYCHTDHWAYQLGFSHNLFETHKNMISTFPIRALLKMDPLLYHSVHLTSIVSAYLVFRKLMLADDTAKNSRVIVLV